MPDTKRINGRFQSTFTNEELDQFLASGNTQAAAAEHFGVTPSAISSRLKRRGKPKSTRKLPARQQAFVSHVASGMQPTQAANMAYNTSKPSAIASKLLGNPKIQLAISDTLALAGISLERRAEKLTEIMETGKDENAIKAISEANKMDGSYAPQKSLNIQAKVDISPVNLDDYRN